MQNVGKLVVRLRCFEIKVTNPSALCVLLLKGAARADLEYKSRRRIRRTRRKFRKCCKNYRGLVCVEKTFFSGPETIAKSMWFLIRKFFEKYFFYKISRKFVEFAENGHKRVHGVEGIQPKIDEFRT